ncbi:hypothetical protein ACJRO7_030660 [Eucalyptus globulus]|uniref:Uncharacterized protein n=1 Tax=Eucalyptus globulus TaxID=34317 RepID=A0ABD3JII1_EUCGL
MDDFTLTLEQTGLFMGLQLKLIPCGYSLATLVMALRFIVGPLVAAATSAALGIRGNLLCISILQAVLPASIVPFVCASEYKGCPRNTVIIAGGIALLCGSCSNLV